MQMESFTSLLKALCSPPHRASHDPRIKAALLSPVAQGPSGPGSCKSLKLHFTAHASGTPSLHQSATNPSKALFPVLPTLFFLPGTSLLSLAPYSFQGSPPLSCPPRLLFPSNPRIHTLPHLSFSCEWWQSSACIDAFRTLTSHHCTDLFTCLRQLCYEILKRRVLPDSSMHPCAWSTVGNSTNSPWSASVGSPRPDLSYTAVFLFYINLIKREVLTCWFPHFFQNSPKSELFDV